MNKKIEEIERACASPLPSKEQVAKMMKERLIPLMPLFASTIQKAAQSIEQALKKYRAKRVKRSE